KKVNINNNNSLIQGDSIVSDNLNKVTNTNGGMIVADSSLKLSNVNELINAGDNSLIQAADLTLDAVKKINNSENAMMLTSDNLVISNADELVNTNASMLSSGNIKLSSIGKITNTNGLINADDSIYIDNVDVLLNSGTGTTQSSGSGIVANNIDIRSVGLLENTGGSYISSLGDLLNLEQIKHIINDASSMLTSDNNLNITGSMLIKNHGVLYSGNSLSITDIDRLENTGDGSSNVGIINAGKIMIVNVGEIVNSLLAIINSDSYLSFDKINTLINNNSIIQSVNT
ncbi:hypothetical protein, partial [Yersinia proxima]